MNTTPNLSILRFGRNVILLPMLFFLGAATVLATPSFERRYSLPIEIDGQTVLVTVHQDHANPNKFYFLPRVPRLATFVDSQGRVIPRFTLQRYSFDKSPSENPNQGAILQFAVTFGLEPEHIDRIKAALPAAVESGSLAVADPNGQPAAKTANTPASFQPIPWDPARLEVVPIAIKSAKVTFYDPASGESIGGGAPAGLAPSTLESEIPFSAKLDKVGATLNQALISGNTGLPCWFQFEYEVMSEPAGFKLVVNWDQVYQFAKTHEIKKSTERNGWWIFSSKSTVSSEETFTENQLEEKNNWFKVESTTNEVVTPEIVQTYLQPILKKVSEEMYGPEPSPKSVPSDENGVNPETMTAAVETDGSGGGTVNSANARVDVKINRTKKGTETFEFSSRHSWALDGLASGFINIKHLPEDVRKELIPEIIYDSDWGVARLPLPVISDEEIEALGITQLQLGITPVCGDLKLDRKLVQYPVDQKNNLGHWISDNQEVNSLVFNLSRFVNEGGADWKEKAAFKVTKTIRFKAGDRTITIRDSIDEVEAQPIFSGGLPSLQPLENMVFAEIDPGLITFGDGGPLKQIDRILVDISAPDGMKVSKTFTPDDTAPLLFPMKAVREEFFDADGIDRVRFRPRYEVAFQTISNSSRYRFEKVWEDEALFIDDNILYQAQLLGAGRENIADLARWDIEEVSSSLAQALEISPLFLTFGDESGPIGIVESAEVTLDVGKVAMLRSNDLLFTSAGDEAELIGVAVGAPFQATVKLRGEPFREVSLTYSDTFDPAEGPLRLSDSMFSANSGWSVANDQFGAIEMSRANKLEVSPYYLSMGDEGGPVGKVKRATVTFSTPDGAVLGWGSHDFQSADDSAVDVPLFAPSEGAGLAIGDEYLVTVSLESGSGRSDPKNFRRLKMTKTFTVKEAHGLFDLDDQMFEPDSGWDYEEDGRNNVLERYRATAPN